MHNSGYSFFNLSYGFWGVLIKTDLVIYVNEFYLDNLKKVSAIAGEETVYDFKAFKDLLKYDKFFPPKYFCHIMLRSYESK